MSEHSPFGGSQIGLVALCPASYQMSLDAPDTDTASMKWGREMHAALGPGAEQPADGFDLALIDFVRSERDTTVEELFGEPEEERYELHLGPLQLHVEDDLRPHSTLDYFASKGSVAYIEDAKFGMNPLTDIFVSGQMVEYAALVFQEFPGVETIHVAVSHAPAQVVYRKEFSRTDRLSLLVRISQIIQTAVAPAPELRPSPTACSRCRGAVRCPMARSKMSELKRLPLLKNLAPQKRSDLFSQAKMVLAVAQEVIKQITAHEAENPGSVPGYKITEQTRRSQKAGLGDISAAVEGHIDEDRFWGFLQKGIKPTMGAIEKAWKLCKPQLSAKQIKAEVNAVLSECIKRNTTVSLKPTTEDK